MATPEQKGVVDAIIDEQIDAKALAAEAHEAGIALSDRLVSMARKVHARVMAGVIIAAQGKALMREGYISLVLLEYARLAIEVQDKTDEHLKAQAEEIAKYGKPLNTIPAIRNPDIQAREAEKAGLTNGGK